MNRSALTIAITCVYLFMVVVVFGHAYSNSAPEKINVFTGTMRHKDSVEISLESVLSALVWPLYVSVQIQKEKK